MCQLYGNKRVQAVWGKMLDLPVKWGEGGRERCLALQEAGEKLGVMQGRIDSLALMYLVLREPAHFFLIFKMPIVALYH